MIGGAHSSLLQQACQLTGGIYSKPARPMVLLEYLLVKNFQQQAWCHASILADRWLAAVQLPLQGSFC